MRGRSLPRTWRHVSGYGSRTYMFVNEAGKRFWATFHFLTNQGMERWSSADAGVGDRRSGRRSPPPRPARRGQARDYPS